MDSDLNTISRRIIELQIEHRDLAKGNVGGAEYWNKKRAEEQHEVNAERRDLHRDRKDLRHDVKDRNHDVHARNDEVRERNHAAAKM